MPSTVLKDGKSEKSLPKSVSFITITSKTGPFSSVTESFEPKNELIDKFIFNPSLRTSETNYLNEAFSFYSAIRARGYYSKANKEERCDLMVKKLRYYARFIVVCLLLKKMKLVRDLVRVSNEGQKRKFVAKRMLMVLCPKMQELAKHIEDYTTVYEPDDQLEWSLVLSEIKAFIEADNLTTVIDVDNLPVIISHRLNPLNTPPPLEKLPAVHLSLQEILIVGNVTDQIKFSELTLDMFRMLQALEREPQDDQRSSSGTRSFAGNPLMPGPGPVPPGATGDTSRPLGRDNPHKYLLYKPTIHQLLVFLSCGFKELPPNGVLLLYLSADGSYASGQQYPTGTGPNNPMVGSMGPGANYYAINNPNGLPTGYDLGGVACNARCMEQSVVTRNNLLGASLDQQQLIDPCCLHPGDLFVFLRKPLCLVVDSDNARAFEHLPRLFGQPMLVLMSPEEAPPPFQQQQQQHGSLFTLFLHCPLTALCLISNIIEMPLQIWDKAQIGVDRFLLEAGRLLMRSRSVDPVFVQFYADDFLRLLILRFIFCSVLLRMHRLFRVSCLLFLLFDKTVFLNALSTANLFFQLKKGRSYAPCSLPPLPDPEIIEHPTLRRAVHEIAITLDIRSHFTEIEDHD